MFLLAERLQAVSTMRTRLLFLGLPLLGLTGCMEPKEAADPGAIVREEIVTRTGPPSRDPSRTVRVGVDADGDLHIAAPQGSVVTVPEDGNPDHPAEAQVVLPERHPVEPRRSKSLGFIGDEPLTQIPSRGGPWNVPDALLPQHRHVEPRYGGYGGYSVRPYGNYGGGYGVYSNHTSSWSQSQSSSSGSRQSQSYHSGGSSAPSSMGGGGGGGGTSIPRGWH